MPRTATVAKPGPTNPKSLTPRIIPWIALILSLLFPKWLVAQENGGKTAVAPTTGIDRLPWIQGPKQVQLDGRATLQIPQGFRFLESKAARDFLKATGNRPSGQETGLLMHTHGEWWVILEFEEIGYVKDDEKSDLDAQALLESYRRGTEEMNRSREERGSPPIRIVGWHVAPNYNDLTKNLEWSVEAESGGNRFVNYNVRLL
ncbi:MAG: DUF2167 domain-containing protein, partial [Verrucomicrobiota bacterium]